MGFLDLFRKKKETEIIKFNDLPLWLENYFEQLGMNSRISEFKNSFSEKMKEIYEALEKLEHAQLMNKNIHPKAQHIMEGNRANYIRQIRFFFQNIMLPDDYENFQVFSQSFPQKLNELSRITQKNYFVLKEFFDQEAYQIVKKIKELENDTMRLMQDLGKKKVEGISLIKNKLYEYGKAERLIQELKLRKEAILIRINDLEERQKIIKSRLNNCRESKQYSEYDHLIKKEESIQNDILKQRKAFLEVFLQLEKPLKKFEHQSIEENLIKDYLEDPVLALKSDAELKITEVLQKMQDSLEQLNIKDRQKTKVIETIAQLDKAFLGDARNRFLEMEEELKKVKSEITRNTICLNIQEQESLLKNNVESLSIKKHEVKELDEKLEKLNLDEIKDDIGKGLLELNAELEK